MDNIQSLVWFGLMIFFVIVEAVGPQLVSVWFAGGALVSMIVSFFSDLLWLQVTVFIVVSVLLLLLTKPFVKRKKGFSTIKTNSDSLIGQTGVVCTPIDNVNATGTVKISGQIWSARSLDGSCIDEGERVIVERIEGVKLIVKK